MWASHLLAVQSETDNVNIHCIIYIFSSLTEKQANKYNQDQTLKKPQKQNKQENYPTNKNLIILVQALNLSEPDFSAAKLGDWTSWNAPSIPKVMTFHTK